MDIHVQFYLNRRDVKEQLVILHLYDFNKSIYSGIEVQTIFTKGPVISD